RRAADLDRRIELAQGADLRVLDPAGPVEPDVDRGAEEEFDLGVLGVGDDVDVETGAAAAEGDAADLARDHADRDKDIIVRAFVGGDVADACTEGEAVIVGRLVRGVLGESGRGGEGEREDGQYP